MILETQTTSERQAPAPVRSSDLLAVSYGGGTNSTAMLCGFRERGIKPDLILFADTGAEMPHTYEYLKVMQDRVREWWGMEIAVVRKLYQGEHEGLEGQCLRRKELPGLAYGHKSCSIKYKGEPQDNALKKWAKENGHPMPIRKAIGFDAGESHRTRPTSAAPDIWWPWYPLVEWQWWREECQGAICRAKMPQPGKSSCYFCPAMKRSEVVRLKEQHPELLNRALAIEDAAQETVTTKRGLGGQGNLWREWLAMDDAQVKLMLDIEPHETPCGCIDG